MASFAMEMEEPIQIVKSEVMPIEKEKHVKRVCNTDVFSRKLEVICWPFSKKYILVCKSSLVKLYICIFVSLSL